MHPRILVIAVLVCACSETGIRSKDADTAAPTADTPPSTPGTRDTAPPTRTTPTPDTATTSSDRPPMVDAVRIEPAEAYETSVLTCIAEASDPDGDPVALTLSWAVDGVSAGVDGPTLDGRAFDKHGDVVCTATPDGGEARPSDPVRIRNTPPVQPTPRIAPDPAVVGDLLVCLADPPTDVDPADVSALRQRFAWRVDGAPIAESSDSLYTFGAIPGQTVACEVTPADPDDLGAPAVSAPVVLDPGCSPGERDCPGEDCLDLLGLGVVDDGRYWIDPPCAGPLEVWCDQTTDGGGWTQVRDDDYATVGCPAPWVAHEAEPLCTRDPAGALAQSIDVETWCIDYSEVRGGLVAYQYGSVDSYGDAVPVDIEAIYGDGVALTVGGAGARSHVWTWTIGFKDGGDDDSNCPHHPGGAPAPAFVGGAWSCDTANHSGASPDRRWYAEEPLFVDTSFQASAPVPGSLEVRLLATHGQPDEDVGLGAVQLLVR
ncbi:MAG: hypothetical protein ACI8PZ_001836 [Myxococcota bacterium]